MKLLSSLCIALSVVLGACQSASTYEKLDNGILISVSDGNQNPQKIKLEVISEKIIHVSVSPTDSFSHQKSLMIEDKTWKPVSWSVEENKDQITLKTKQVHASVSVNTGEIVFTDTTGQIILQEKNHGGKTFTSKVIENEKLYGIQQVFESPEDEAFYGLGQHQNGEMNYKGQDVELAQHNIVAVVPFLYSTKNYGLLWDNYSITRFGDARDFQPLSSLHLFSRTDNEGGLSTDFYVGDSLVSTQLQNEIDYEFLETTSVDNFPKKVAQNGKVIWEGSFSSPNPGRHKFLLYASGYFKLWIDGNLVLDKWRQGWNPWSNKFDVHIKNGERHTIKIEWNPDGGAYISLKHLDPIPTEEQNRLTLSSEAAKQIDYYFVKGDDADDVIHGYRELTGNASLIPKWAFGFWQSRERYKTQKELLDVVKTFRKEGIPLDNIVLDWNYWNEDQWGSHQFDTARFPDPAGMVKELHDELHANIIISVWPKFYPGTENFNEMDKAGFLFTRNLEKKRIDWIAQGYHNTFYNPFKPNARKLFWNQIDRNLNKIDIDGWWLDATEPDMHSNLSIEERKLNMSPTGMGPGALYFNAYSLMNSKGVFEGQRQSNPDKRVFILTRSAFAGQQRFGSVTWSGDIVSRWSDFKDQISAGVNFSLSGIPFWTMDIGGFATERRYSNQSKEHLDEWRELNVRWFQFGSFCPLFRVHGQFPYRELYNVAPKGNEVYNTMLYYNKLRYKLMPYIYTLAGKASVEDYTMMRGLVMDFNSDPKVRNINDQYMFGPSLLINPVTEYKARKGDVYLPASTGWYDLHSGKYYEGGQTLTVEAPLTNIPVFAKEGSIIPTGPEIQYTTEKPVDPLTVYVFKGKDGAFELYEDDNTSNQYEEGKFSTIAFTYSEQSQTIIIGERQGSFSGMLTERTIHFVWVKKDKPVGLGQGTQPDQVVRYNGNKVEIKLTN
ncbi:MAG TPA: glycoside hydrolase family 31 protein [Chryseolinea sp.]|nr:glycoside hydrolase family 31 protein [Chryseolinea sp.]